MLVGIVAATVSYVFFLAASEALLGSRTRDFESSEGVKYLGAVGAKRVSARYDYYFLLCHAGTLISLFLAGVIVACSLFPGGFLGHAAELAGKPLTLVGATLLFALIALVVLQAVRSLVFVNPERALCCTAYVLLFFGWATKPLLVLLDKSQRALLALLHLPVPEGLELTVSSEEISAIVERSSEAGEIEEEESEMIQGVIEFSDSVVREVMTPRKDIVAVEDTAGLDHIISVFTRERLSRVLVVGSDLDDVKGILLAKDLLPLVGRGKIEDFDLRRFLRPPYTVPESKKTDELLQEFKERAVHFAVVLDEHGGVAGVVTVEDLVEEIVGEIFDEFDKPEEEIGFRETKSGDVVVHGSALLHDLNEEYGYDFPEGEYDTFAGFVIHLLGRIPLLGEVVQHSGATIKIEGVVGNRVTRLRIVNGRKAAPQPALAEEIAANSKG